MKIFKRGFTLAEMLVTMGLIGVVVAMTVPTIMTDSKNKQYVAKIAKFNSVLENGASEYAAAHNDFSSSDEVLDFIKTSFSYKNKTEKDKITSLDAVNIELKDGTIITAVSLPSSTSSLFSADTDLTGKVYFYVGFNPNVSGKNSSTNTVVFGVTEKGYVFPDNSNTNQCLKALYNNKWKYNVSLFSSGGACD